MTLKFNRVLEVVEVHARTKFHQLKCSSSNMQKLQMKNKLFNTVSKFLNISISRGRIQECCVVYLSCSQTFCLISQWRKIRKTGPPPKSCTLWVGPQYVFMQNFMRRFVSYRVNREENNKTPLKTILPSLPRAVKSTVA